MDTIEGGAIAPTLVAGRSLRLQTDDTDAIADACLHWSIDLLRTRGGAFRASLALAQGDAVQLLRHEFSGPFRAQGRIPPGCVSLVLPDCAIAPLSRGRPVPVGEIDVIDDDGSDYSIFGPGQVLVVSIARDLFEELAEAALGRHLAAIAHRARLRLASDASRRQLRLRLRALLRMALRWPWLLQQPELRSVWQGAIVQAVFAATAHAVPSPPPTPRSRLALAAEAHLRACAPGPMDMAALSAAHGVSERMFQSAFRERFGLTPAAYSRVLRLRGARRDLRKAEDGTSVTQVALQWGFDHLGRFALDYRHFFGCSPSDERAHAVRGRAAKHASFTI